jgi:methylmalonyl-CoA/ethylmalonyl-CoA epimerase
MPRHLERGKAMSEKSTSTPAAVHFDKIGQIALTVTDLARAKDFYQNTLGMKPLFDAGNMSFFQCGDIRLLIGASDKPVAKGSTILYFKIENIDAAHAYLKERGVEFTQAPHLVARMPDHDLWLASFTDPDGNALEMMSEISRT